VNTPPRSAPGKDRRADADATRTLLARITAWDLDRCNAVLPTSALGDADWSRLIGLARTQRAEGPLTAAIVAGALVVTPSQQDQAFAAHRAAMSLALVLERELVELHERFVGAGIDHRVVKGAATAHLDEIDPSLRAFGDIDLLVASRSLPAAVRIVEQAGGARRHLEPRPGFDARFSKGVSFRFTRNCEIDLHRTLAPGPFGLLIDLDDLFASSQGLPIADHELLALDRPGRFLHACYHAALGDARPRLTSLRDLVHTAPRSDTECRVVLGRAARWRSRAVVRAAVDHARHAFGWRPPEPLASWARRELLPAREERWLAAYAGEGRLPALQAIQAIAAVDGVFDRLAYARAIALPAPSAGRTPTGERARRGARALARLTRP
jgi:hypothetical protein